MTEKRIFETIKEAILAEEEELKRMGKGIFFAPELAIAYYIGKRIYRDRTKIFDQPFDRVIWHREINLIREDPAILFLRLNLNREIPGITS